MSFVCRVCRMEIFTHPFSLTDSSLRHVKTIDEMIYECTHIKLTKDSHWPQFICESCLLRLEDSYAFLLLCRESQQFYMNTLQAEGPLELPDELPATLDNKLENIDSNLISVKLEVDPEEILNSSDYTDGTFPALNMLPTISSRTGDPKAERNWMVEARKHRERQRISTARRRARMSPQEREKERERARLKQAQRRASRSEDQIRKQRERDRLRQAMKRAKFREVEMIQQQQPDKLGSEINHCG
ncbi:chromatin assembly factor 1 subunit A-B-like [Toxorhynchites rutilus septentrionalis]|uniref:chromatin assembly factor 1 subunit A-B-like n=1 Tax=Toxorhynchites rutilus septentrionalis TaxID=329112 RepID=UPI00247B1D50|nr:chromatin assembly factor 1 subunit A-B-like [Toxorhynchites rutilus septentrionalis]